MRAFDQLKVLPMLNGERHPFIGPAPTVYVWLDVGLPWNPSGSKQHTWSMNIQYIPYTWFVAPGMHACCT